MNESEPLFNNHIQMHDTQNNEESRRRFKLVQFGVVFGIVFSVFLVIVVLLIFVQDPAHHHPSIDIKYPLVINTWNFINATRVAFAVLQNESLNALDALEQGCAYCEMHPWECGYSVGYGGSPNEEGETTFDAMVMWAPTHSVGAVGYMKNISQGIAVARKVMEETYHTFLVGEDATNFAVLMGFQKVDLTTERSYQQWYNWATVGNHTPNYWKHHHTYPNINTTTATNSNTETPLNSHERMKRHQIEERRRPPVGPDNHDTIGMIVIDRDGNIACGTSTNGMTYKIAGRVGDSPIPGTGAYCDNDIGGAAETGDGDVMMRFAPSVRVVELMKAGLSPSEACQKVIDHITRFYPDSMAAIVAVNNNGEYGAAYANVGNGFPFSYQDKTMSEAQIITVTNK